MECCGERVIMLGPLYFVELKPYPKCEGIYIYIGVCVCVYLKKTQTYFNILFKSVHATMVLNENTDVL